MAEKKITASAVGISVTGYVPHAAREYDDNGASSMVKPIATEVERIGQRLLEFETEVAAIEADKRLSDEGRAEKRVQVFEKHHDGLGKELGERVGLGEKEIGRLRNVSPPPPSDDPNAIQVASDIRAHVAGLSDSERRAFLNQRAADPQVVSAVFSAPPYLSGMSDVELEVYRKRVLQTMHPERAERIELLEATIDGALKGLRNATRMLVARAGVRFDRKAEKWVPERTNAQIVPRGLNRGGPRKHTLTGL